MPASFFAIRYLETYKFVYQEANGWRSTAKGICGVWV